jgi:hypothetical protein
MGLIQDFLTVFADVEHTEKANTRNSEIDYRCLEFFVKHGAALKAQLAPANSGFGLPPLQREGGPAGELWQRAEAIAASPWSYSSRDITALLEELMGDRVMAHERVRREPELPIGKRYCAHHRAEYDRKRREYFKVRETLRPCVNCGEKLTKTGHDRGDTMCADCNQAWIANPQEVEKQRAFAAASTVPALKHWIAKYILS